MFPFKRYNTLTQYSIAGGTAERKEDFASAVERVWPGEKGSKEAGIAPITAGNGQTAEIEPLSACGEIEPAERFGGMAEQFRTMRARLLTLHPSPTVIVVSSPLIGDGKTVSAINLAAALAAPTGEQVLLIDADMRRPSVQKRLEIDSTIGLQEVLRGRERFEKAIVSEPRLGNLSVLPAGASVAQPAALLGTSHWKDLIGQFRKRYSRIVIDTPPVHGLGDYPLIAQPADGVLLVCRIDHTPRAALAESIRITGSKLLGIILNGLTEELLCKTPGARYYRNAYRSERNS
ncbi:MAG: CpsD/CapB family tyrosine-protein kinase [Acidobacteriota bacterium]|nr:CpsD/CapB family tyrosine-protein kinase [Acidobacteriota bacterium]